jgi:hypothetical protein
MVEEFIDGRPTNYAEYLFKKSGSRRRPELTMRQQEEQYRIREDLTTLAEHYRVIANNRNYPISEREDAINRFNNIRDTVNSDKLLKGTPTDNLKRETYTIFKKEPQETEEDEINRLISLSGMKKGGRVIKVKKGKEIQHLEPIIEQPSQTQTPDNSYADNEEKQPPENNGCCVILKQGGVVRLNRSKKILYR